MLIKRRKQFNSSRQQRPNGGNLFTDIISKITSAATSETGKTLSKAAVEGLSKGVKSGAEEGSKQLIRKVTSKLTKEPHKQSPTSWVAPTPPPKPVKHTPSVTTQPGDIDSSTRMLLNSLKGSGLHNKRANAPTEGWRSGSGIKILK